MTRSNATRQSTPTFFTLARDECLALLARHHLCRVAYSFRDRVDIEPLHYVYENGFLYGRTAPGAKLATLAHRPWVAVEVDEADGLFEWRSVVARGSFNLLDPDGSPHSRTLHAQAIVTLRRLLPDTMSPGDPVAFREAIFRVALDEVTGRAAVMR